MIQGMGGIMSITGEAGGDPMRIGVAYADVFTGVYSAVAILAALAEREKTGRGAHLDMALLDTQVSVLANQSLFYLVSGRVPPRLGNAHATVVPYQVFPVADGHMIIACGNDAQFVRLSAVLGEPGLAQNPDYKTNAGRVVHRDALIPRMTRLTAKFTRDDLLKKLEAVGVPAGPINTLADVFADPQVLAREMRIDRPSAAAKGGIIPGVRAPITINSRHMASDRPSPELGEHTQEILREIGEV
jgi:crotonobetainyl-CoA:carnitine CoA-transferase CaiB-like acyl-CoA transferase